MITGGTQIYGNTMKHPHLSCLFAACRSGNTNRTPPLRPAVHVSPARPVVERRGAGPVVRVSPDKRLRWMAQRGVFLASEDSTVRRVQEMLAFFHLCKKNQQWGKPSKVHGIYDGWVLWTLNTWIHQYVLNLESIWIKLYTLQLPELHPQVEGAAQCLQCTGGKSTIEQVGLDASVVCFSLTSKHAEHSQVVSGH